MIGRAREMEELTAAFEGVARNARSRLVSVVGVAGIGKSRLARELYRYFERRRAPVTWLVGRTPAYGAGLAHAALADMVRKQFRIADRDGPEVARRKLHAALPLIAADDAERAWLESRLTVLVDPATDAGYERYELFSAWRRFFELLSERAPVALIVEDAHRADAGMLDFVEACIESARDRPILIVTLARPELLDLRPAWGAGLRNFTSLHLDRLSNDELTQLLGELAPALSPRVLSQVLRRADGVPLYAVEMTRMLQDSQLTEGRLAGGTTVPGSLHALIAARIDSLPAGDRSLVLSASVFGRQFTPAALAAVAEVEPDALRRSVDRLVRHEILATDGDARTFTAGLRFREQLVQEVAYRTLSRADKRRLHLAAAGQLEALGDEDLVEAVANHLVKAYQADPAHAQAPAIAERARPVLIKAAERARALHAPDRALIHLEDALATVTDVDERAPLTEEAAAAAQAAGRFDTAEHYWRDLIGLRTSAADRPGAARATARLASLLFVVQRTDAGLAEVEAAINRLGEVSRDDPASVELSGQLARAHLLRGDAGEARAWADRALEHAERIGLHPVATDALITRGAALVAMGEERAGVDDLNRAIEQCAEGDLLGLELRARNNLAWLLVADDPRRTLESARRGFELGHQKGLRDMALQLASVAFVTAVDTGDWDWALTAIDELDDEAMAPSHRLDVAATSTIIRALRGEGKPERALTRLEPFPAETDAQVLAQVAYARAWVAFLRGRFRRARELAGAAVAPSVGFSRHAALVLSARAALWAGDAAGAQAVLDSLRTVPLNGRAAAAAVETIAAGAAAHAGRLAEARTGYRKAIALWRELDLPFPLALALLERDAFLPPARGKSSAEALALIDRLRGVGLAQLARHAAPPEKGS
jgi:tetratricopeptide (TPR) repeat protein